MVKTLLAVTALFRGFGRAGRGDCLVGGNVPRRRGGDARRVAIDMGPFIDVASPTGEKPKLVCWEVKHNSPSFGSTKRSTGRSGRLDTGRKRRFKSACGKREPASKWSAGLRSTPTRTPSRSRNRRTTSPAMRHPVTGATCGDLLADLKEPILAGKEKDTKVSALRVLYFSCDPARAPWCGTKPGEIAATGVPSG